MPQRVVAWGNFMFINYRTQGFFLNKADRGEADQLLTVFTEDFGKLEILARSIRKISSKLKSGTEIFYLSEIEFIQGKIQKTLTDAILIDKFEDLRKDLNKLKITYRITEAFGRLVQGQEKDETLWQLLNEVFNILNNWKIESWKLKITYHYFLWNLFSVLGYQPQLYNCALCQERLVPGEFFFSPKEGGIICQKHNKELKLGKPSQILQNKIWTGKKISLESIKILRIILKKDWLLFSKLKIEKTNLESLDRISNEYYSYILNQSGAGK